MTPSRSLDDNFSAGRPCLCARCVRIRRPNMHTTCERRKNASSEVAVVAVEVDRCVDENSASNLSPSFTEAPSIKYTSRQCIFPVCYKFMPRRTRSITSRTPRVEAPGRVDRLQPPVRVVGLGYSSQTSRPRTQKNNMHTVD